MSNVFNLTRLDTGEYERKISARDEAIAFAADLTLA
jgi:hypothetical protein